MDKTKTNTFKQELQQEVKKISSHPLTYPAVTLCDLVEDFELSHEVNYLKDDLLLLSP